MFAKTAKGDNPQQVFCLLRQRAETVYHTLAEPLHILVALHPVQFAVEKHALAACRHIVLAEVHRQVAIELAIIYHLRTLHDVTLAHLFGIEFVELFVAQFGDSLRENLLIGLVAEVGDEAALFGTQQIAGAADVEVLHGNVDATAQVAEVLDGLQTATRIEVEGRERRCQQVAERLLIRAPYPTTHLVQVAQAEVMRSVYDNGIGIRNVQAALYDGGGDEDIVVVVGKIDHDPLQLLGRHLSVSHSNAGIGHMLADQFDQFLQLADAVVHKEYLSAAAHLELNGFGNHLGAEAAELRLYRVAVGRWCLDDAQVAGSHQAELQGAGDRCSRQREGIDVGLQLTQFLLCRDAELLLLVDDEQPQVLELDALADELVGADDDVDRAVLQALQNLFRLLGRAGTGQVFYLDGEILQAAREGAEVLIGQHRGRHEYCHLFVIDTCLEGGPDGHLRLAEAHVAADQAVHRALAFHIQLDVLRSLQLVGRVLI